MTHADDWPPENIFEKAIRYRGIGTDHIALSKFKQDHFFKPQATQPCTVSTSSRPNSSSSVVLMKRIW